MQLPLNDKKWNISGAGSSVAFIHYGRSAVFLPNECYTHRMLEIVRDFVCTPQARALRDKFNGSTMLGFDVHDVKFVPLRLHEVYTQRTKLLLCFRFESSFYLSIFSLCCQ